MIQEVAAFRLRFAVKAKKLERNIRVEWEREREINAFWFYIHERGCCCDRFPLSYGAHWNSRLRFSSFDLESRLRNKESSNSTLKSENFVLFYSFFGVGNQYFSGNFGCSSSSLSVCVRLVVEIKERTRENMSWRRVLKSVQALAAHTFLFSFTLLLVLKLDHVVSCSWWSVLSL